MEKILGTMIDCSRNAVISVDTVKRYANIIRKMGYNTLMLYTEDTYEVDNQPYFGHLRGKYSKEELKDIDEYCKSIGIELVPCIQTLAHLENMFKWKTEYDDINDCDNILLADNEKTYKLIEDMISTVSQCFTSKKLHIGMDEAHRVGTGKYQTANGIRDRFDIINEHLHKVCEIAAKYGFEPMIWSDMFCKLAMNTEDQYKFSDKEAEKILEKGKLPENITLVYWDYYETEYENYIRKIKANKVFGRKVYFAGGARIWGSFAPDNAGSIKSTQKAIQACVDSDLDGMFFTEWGDNGAECSIFAVLPTLMYAAEAANGNTDTDSIKAKFKEIVGCEYDSFMIFDKLDRPDETFTDNASKYFLYNDFFMGTREFKCKKGFNAFYDGVADEIHKVKEKGEFVEMFDSFEKLAKVLAVKTELGMKTREAYLKRDFDELRKVIVEYDVFVERLDEFYNAHQKRWFKDNKPHGFDVQDIRFGGLKQRALSCQKRLKQLVSGEVSEIPELDEPVFNQQAENGWAGIVTANAIM